MGKNYCIYHNADFDGVASAAIIYNHICKTMRSSLELFGMNYGDEFPFWDKIDKDDVVYMVDFSLPFNDMILLNDITTLIWIDHHATAINDIKDSDIYFEGVQKSGIGACRLVWDYIHSFKRSEPPFDKLVPPYAIELLSEYDVWIKDNPDTVPFQYGLKIVDNIMNPTIPVWTHLLKADKDDYYIKKIIESGESVVKYIDVYSESYCDIAAYPMEWEGHKVICINCSTHGTGSNLFKSVWDEKKYDFMIGYVLSKNGSWNVGLYSDKEGIHVGNIAKKYGGGGHPGAAGFICDELPFK